jgi:RNA polymerase sigma factor FliA
VAAAKLYRLRSDNAVSFPDYLQYARLGLVEAIDGFDPARETSFETYSSYRIRGAVLDGIARENETAAQRTFWRTRLEERASLGSEPVLDDRVDETLDANPHAVTELAELHTVVDQLPGRERELIRRHYFDHCEFRVIARELTVTPGRVSQLHAQALLRIRDLLDSPVTASRPSARRRGRI